MTSIILISLCLHLQSNLDDMMLTWNHHRIRPYRDMNGPVGKPVVLFHAPETVGFRNQMKHVGMQQLQICRQESSRKPSSCEETVHEICCIAMIENAIFYQSAYLLGLHNFRRLGNYSGLYSLGNKYFLMDKNVNKGFSTEFDSVGPCKNTHKTPTRILSGESLFYRILFVHI